MVKIYHEQCETLDWGQPLAGKLLITNYAVRDLTDPYLDPQKIAERENRDRVRNRATKDQAIQVCARTSEMERVVQKHPQRFERLTTVYGYNPADLTHPLTTREMTLLLRHFDPFEELMTKAKVTVCDLINTASEVRELVLDNLYYILGYVEKANMPVPAFLQLDAVKMQAFFHHHAHFRLSELVSKPEYKLSWDFIFKLSAEDYYQIDVLGACEEGVFFFSDPRHTDHLTIPEIVAALAKSPKEAVWTFLEVQGNVDKLFAWISEKDYSAIGSSRYSKSPGGIGPLRPKPSTAWKFEHAMGWALSYLKGHALYYERTKEHVPRLIHSLDDLKKVLKKVFPHQCKDVLEALRARWGQLIKTPNDLAQLLNYFKV